MREVGNVIFYAGSGVCRVSGIQAMDVAGESRNYYVLSPIFKKSSTLYVPCDSEPLTARMVPMLEKEQIEKALLEAEEAPVTWVRDFRQRSESARRTLLSTDRLAILVMMRSIYAHKREMAQSGKTLHTTDDYILRDAENLIFQEFAYVLALTPTQAGSLVKSHLSPEE